MPDKKTDKDWERTKEVFSESLRDIPGLLLGLFFSALERVRDLSRNAWVSIDWVNVVLFFLFFLSGIAVIKQPNSTTIETISAVGSIAFSVMWVTPIINKTGSPPRQKRSKD